MSSTQLATAFVARFDTLRMSDVEAVGGKNASLGEMISQLSESGVRVPGGFATTAHAFRTFLSEGGLARRIADRLASLDTDDVRALAAASRHRRFADRPSGGAGPRAGEPRPGDFDGAAAGRMTPVFHEPRVLPCHPPTWRPPSSPASTP